MKRYMKIVFIVLMFIFALIVTVANLQNLEIGFVSNRSIDEWAFFSVINSMTSAYEQGKVKAFLDYHFLSYGFPYFFIQWLLTYPAMKALDYNSVLFIMREFSLFWVLGYVLLVFIWVARRTESAILALICSLVLLLQPGMWKEAMHIHPDHMMTFFLIATFMFLDFSGKANRWRPSIIAGILFALALSSKIQAFIYLPAVLILLSWDVYRFTSKAIIFKEIVHLFLRKDNLLEVSRRLFLFLVTGVSLWCLLNPYILQDWGWERFVHNFSHDMKSNATNHFAYNVVPLDTKLNMLSWNYYNMSTWLSFYVITLFSLIMVDSKTKRVVSALFLVSVIVMAYLLFFVNKSWHHYYLTLFVLITVMMFLSIGSIEKYVDIKKILLTGVVLLISLNAVAHTIIKILPTIEGKVKDNTNNIKRSLQLESKLRDFESLNEKTIIVISPRTPFRFEKIGIPFSNIKVIWGPLKKAYAEQGDILIIRKDDHYFDGERSKGENEQAKKYREARSYLDEIIEGRSQLFKMCTETQHEYIFCKFK